MCSASAFGGSEFTESEVLAAFDVTMSLSCRREEAAWARAGGQHE